MGALTDIIQLIPGYDPVATAGDCHFDEEAAQLALDFFPECLRHVKGPLGPTPQRPAQPFLLQPWQQGIVANLFGWKRPSGMRRYRRVFLYVPRKNGKSMTAAGIALYVLFCDGEPGAEIYSAAVNREQAALVFAYAAGMIRQEENMNDRCTVYGGGPAGQAKTITLKDYSGYYKVLSGDDKAKDGFNTHLAVIDELHGFDSRKLVDVLMTSVGSRTQPIILITTTADHARVSVCNEELQRARQVRDGIIADESLLPVIYEGSLKDDWTSPAVWERVNPNLGISVFRDYLRDECQKAQELPTYENTFKRLHLNIQTEQATRWLPMDKWDACNGEVDAEALKGEECYVGLDLATTQDLAACVLFFPNANNAVLPFFWVPGENAQKRERRDHVPYETWARQGYIELTSGNVTDQDIIEERIIALGEIYNIREIAIDRWNTSQITTHLMDAGFDVILFGQGFGSMSYPTREVEKMVMSGKLRHGGHPVLWWNASNVAVQHKRDAADNIKPDKDKSTEKIDGIVALVMAVGRAMVRQKEPKSVYETRGVLTI